MKRIQKGERRLFNTESLTLRGMRGNFCFRKSIAAGVKENQRPGIEWHEGNEWKGRAQTQRGKPFPDRHQIFTFFCSRLYWHPDICWQRKGRRIPPRCGSESTERSSKGKAIMK